MEQGYKNRLNKNETIKKELIEVLSDYNFESEGKKLNYNESCTRKPMALALG